MKDSGMPLRITPDMVAMPMLKETGIPRKTSTRKAAIINANTVTAFRLLPAFHEEFSRPPGGTGRQ